MPLASRPRPIRFPERRASGPGSSWSATGRSGRGTICRRTSIVSISPPARFAPASTPDRPRIRSSASGSRNSPPQQGRMRTAVRGKAMKRSTSPARSLLVACSLLLVSASGGADGLSFAPGDVMVSLEPGPVQWWNADGTLNRILASTVPGTGEGMAFDGSGNLYVSRWCIDPWCGPTGNTVEWFNVKGESLGAVGSGYNCNPHAILFDATNTAYIGQAGCSGAIMKVPPGQDRSPTNYNVAWDNQGSFWIDLAPDGCTMFYTSYGANVKRFDVCAGVQLPDFNLAPVPGGVAHDVRVLPDGGVIVATGSVISRLDQTGALSRTYSVAGEPAYWAGVDLTGDGAFWAANYESSRVHKFDLGTGRLLATIDAHTPPHTVVAVRIKK